MNNSNKIFMVISLLGLLLVLWWFHETTTSKKDSADIKIETTDLSEIKKLTFPIKSEVGQTAMLEANSARMNSSEEIYIYNGFSYRSEGTVITGESGILNIKSKKFYDLKGIKVYTSPGAK